MKSILEFMGDVTSHGIDLNQPGHIQRPRRSRTYRWEDTGPQTDPSGFIYKYCHQLRSEQQEIVKILQSGSDVFINMGAGGGKTMPIVCYWLNSILGLNVLLNKDLTPAQINEGFTKLYRLLFNNNDIEKLLILVPIKALGIQTQDDFIEVFEILLIQFFSKILNNSIINSNNRIEIEHALNHLSNFSIPNLNKHINNIRNLLNQNGQNKFEINNNINDPNIDQFNHQRLILFNNLKTEIFNFIQNRSKALVYRKDGEGSDGDINSAIVYITIYQSSPNLVNKIKNLKLIIGDEAHKNLPTSEFKTDVQQAKQIAKSLYETLNSIKNKDIQLVFLTGTIHPTSAESFIKILNKCFNRKFKKPLNIKSGNRTKISIIGDDSLNFKSKWVKIIIKAINRRDFGNLFILYGGYKIEELSENVLKATGEYSHNPRNFNSRRKIGQKTTILSMNDLKKPVSLRDAQHIKNQLLRQCLQHGFGFIHSSKNSNFGPVDTEDKKIVQNLFKQRKISFIIGTDAIGVGLNISAKNMYIPEVEKFNGKDIEKVHP